MASPILIEKQKLVVASVAMDRKLVKSDPALGACLKKLKAEADAYGRKTASFSPGEKADLSLLLGNYAVAKANGLWLFFRPEDERIIDKEKNPYYQPIKFIIADITKGMTGLWDGNVMIALANNRCTHADIFMALRNVVAFDNGISPQDIEVKGINREIVLPNGATASALGGGSLEYTYSREKQAFELYIDQNITSGAYGRTAPSALLEVMARINGCEGVTIRYGRFGTNEKESGKLMAGLRAWALEK